MQLQQLRNLMTSRLSESLSVDTDGVSPILPIITGDPEPTMRASGWLQDQGVFVQGIRPPTVPEGSSRLRVTLMATHQPNALLRAADLIRKVLAP